ncbi:MAG: PDZ domain-containing protein, partial [Nocardioidaceae bacterium]
LGGRPAEGAEKDRDGDASGQEATAPAPETRVDEEGLHQRVVPVPVSGARYTHLQAVQGGLVWLKQPLRGELGEDLPRAGDEPERATLEHIDLATGKLQKLADRAEVVVATADGKQLVVSDGDALRVLPGTHKQEKPESGEDDSVVDLSRVRVEVNPPAEWTQMFHEAWRLMRDHYWRADMDGVNWEGARDRYAPLLGRIGSHDDLIDLIWEMQGELGSSHAYCAPPPPKVDPSRRQGLLGADVELDGDSWRLVRIVPGEPSLRQARSPLTAPGVGARVGDAIVAVDGRPTGPTVSPAQLLVGKAEKPVELTLAPQGGGSARRVVVVPLADEFPLRYQDWVNGRRRYVHERTDGRVGYLHVPDMVSTGWAQLHRDLRTEVGRDALIVDVRGNNGGHTSQLVVEKLARRIIGWDLSRGYQPASYPSDARRGPMVTVTDMYAGSDGDIVTAAIQSLGLGPVVGSRTWGGVIGIDGRYQLVDGTSVTQPRYSFWFERFGWGIENYGVDPDVEVVPAPQDRVARVDVELDRALTLVERELKRTPPLQPPPLPDPRHWSST